MPSGVTASYSIVLDHSLPGWTVVNPSPVGNHVLDCLVFASNTTNLCGSAFGGGMSLWTNPGPSPDHGNYLMLDALTDYESPIQQMINGLTAGQSYTLSFYQASGQQRGQNFFGATTEQWQVSFGSDTQYSTLMNTPSHGSIGWNLQTMTFTASSASELLQFVALGGPNGVPPMVLLDGVSLNPGNPSSQGSVPEPTTAALIGLGLLALPIAAKLRRR